MGAQIQCPHCGQAYALSDQQVPQYAGQTINCTQCQKSFTVPANLSPQASAAPPDAVPALPTAAAGPVDYRTPSQQHGQQQSNGMAIASVVFGALGFPFPLLASIPGIVLGIIGLRRTRNPEIGGKGLAIIGITLGAVSTVLGIVAVGIMIIMMGAMLPSMNRARETANRVKCAANLKAIGNALLLYSNDYAGKYPPDFETLINTQDITFDSFICPTSSDSRANTLPELSTPGHLSYVYVPGLSPNASADTVVVYEHIADHNQDGVNFLFGDGHVDWISKPQAQRMITQIQAGQNPPK